MEKLVWVFNSAGGRFPGAVFTSKLLANEWIKANRLTGTLTAYPLDIGIYDWALSNGYFSIKRDEQLTPEFIGKFTSASQEHYHYEDGEED
ncbi:MAG: hypothetical protein KIT57_07485 [Blastocatellales bacterium]|nr:hypothetical protein [Blastocatellales bacterium]